jgi:hypothetical protein
MQVYDATCVCCVCVFVFILILLFVYRTCGSDNRKRRGTSSTRAHHTGTCCFFDFLCGCFCFYIHVVVCLDEAHLAFGRIIQVGFCFLIFVFVLFF